MHLRPDEIDLSYDDDDPLGLVAELQRALRRHGIKLPSMGLEACYLGSETPAFYLVELGACNGETARQLVDVLNSAEPAPAGEG
ncbi:hypothetical protein EBN88_15775 [Streptomyces triticirhizae]|uniref:Uncharacterized protein n=2 Tax=Streptomyces triticirhizae TaxID=2483353 RepID=A0A3M2LNE0_9ACTN|nr:hypothetical protein [Streptomyces triticirhizae]RMI38981.1 hypothetical protein EBN88_15775 [Streptomyces triticirhizae]